MPFVSCSNPFLPNDRDVYAYVDIEKHRDFCPSLLPAPVVATHHDSDPSIYAEDVFLLNDPYYVVPPTAPYADVDVYVSPYPHPHHHVHADAYVDVYFSPHLPFPFPSSLSPSSPFYAVDTSL